MPNGSLDEIEHIPFNKVIKTLGSMNCPSRSNNAALNRMQQQGQEWMDKVLASTLSRQNIWFKTNCQFWPWIGYGICNNSAAWDELDSCLKRVYWQLIGRGGVQRFGTSFLATARLRLLWDWMPTLRGGMPGGTNHQASCTLWM